MSIIFIHTAPRTSNRQQKTDNIKSCWLLINHQIGEMGVTRGERGWFIQSRNPSHLRKLCFKSYPLTGWLYNITNTKYLAINGLVCMTETHTVSEILISDALNCLCILLLCSRCVKCWQNVVRGPNRSGIGTVLAPRSGGETSLLSGAF